MTKKVIMEIPKEEPIKFNADLVFEVLKKHKADGLSNVEIAEASGVKLRRVREETQQLKQQGLLIQRLCRCGRTPFYYLK